MTGGGKGGGEGSGTFSITGKFLTSLASHFEEAITGMNMEEEGPSLSSQPISHPPVKVRE